MSEGKYLGGCVNKEEIWKTVLPALRSTAVENPCDVNFLHDVKNYAHHLCAASFWPGAAGAGSGLGDLRVEVSSFRPVDPAAGSALGLEVSHVQVASFRPGSPAGDFKHRSSKLSA